MGYVVYIGKLSFTPVDEHGVPTGPDEVVVRGGKVPSYVPPFLINALSNSGVIVNAGPDVKLAPVEETPVSLMSADQPPTPDGRPALPDLGLIADAGDQVNPVGTRPNERDSKAKWEAYAVSVGIEQADAESLSKAELQARVAEREAATS